MDSIKYDELHGINNWNGLLEPFDLDLRKLLLAYGDFALTSELTMNAEAGKFCGLSRYGMSSLFKSLEFRWIESRYEVTAFIYGTCKIEYKFLVFSFGQTESNWNGYVAVSKDEFSKFLGRREIVVVWRGTARTLEWIEDFGESLPIPAEPLLPNVDTSPSKIQKGLHTIYCTGNPDSAFVKASARIQLLQQIKKLLNKYKGEKISITCTGHSLGACLSVLSGVDIAVNVVSPDILVSVFCFESPQVGNKAFKHKLETIPNLKILSVKNIHDVIPCWPTKIFKGGTWVPNPELLDYVDVGINFIIDSKKSPYLKPNLSFPYYHSLPGVLHTISGWNGMDGEFDWGLLKRSLGLVNISSDMLKQEFKIPCSWSVQKNKGMILNDDDDWVMPEINCKDYDIPPH